MTLNLLARYEARAKEMTTFELSYAIRDVQETLNLYRYVDPTAEPVRKWWAEFDAYTVELYRRRQS